MIEKIITVALETGLMAGLFVGLLIYVLRDSSKREQKYQSMIKQLHDCLNIVTEIRDDVTEIKKKISKEEKKK